MHRRAEIIDSLYELLEVLKPIIVVQGQMLSGDNKSLVNNLSGEAEALTLTVTLRSATLTNTGTPGTVVITYTDASDEEQAITLSFPDGGKNHGQTACLPAGATITRVQTTGWSDGELDITASAFPLHVKTIQKRYVHWTTLDQQGALPSLLLNYGEVLRKRDGGENAEFAALGETEEYLPIVCDVVLKEQSSTPKALTAQVSDAIYTIERIINGTSDLNVEGVCRTRVQEVHTSAGRISALQGTPFEIVRHNIVVTHVYPSNTSV